MVAVGLAVVAAAAVGVLWGLRSSKRSSPPAATERTVAVTTGTIRQTVSASGTLRPADTRNLNFSVSGKVTAVNAVAGKKVSKDTVLATIDSALLQSQVAQAQAAVDSALARLSSDTTAGATTAALSADQAGLNAARAQLASAQTSLAGANLVSPIDGTVASVNLTVGQQLGGSGGSATSLSGSGTGSGESSPAAPAAGNAAASSGSSSTAEIVVINTDSFVVDVGIDDTQIGRIAVGQQATVTPSASVGAAGGSAFARGRAIAAGGTPGGGQAPITTTTAPSAPVGAPAASATGTVTSVGVIASSTSGVATFPVVVTIAGNPSGFYAGATAQVTITYQELPGVLQVPAAAVSRRAGQSFVTVSAGGRRIQRPITTGIAANGAVQVTSGLAAGDQVVITTPVAPTGAPASTGGAGRLGGGGDVGGGDIGGGGGGGAGGAHTAGGAG